MTRQTQLFENATQIAEKKIRAARAEQSAEAWSMVTEGVRSLLSLFRRDATTVQSGGALHPDR